MRDIDGREQSVIAVRDLASGKRLMRHSVDSSLDFSTPLGAEGIFPPASLSSGRFDLSVCPIRLRPKRPCVRESGENLSLGRVRQGPPGSPQGNHPFSTRPSDRGERLKEAEKSRLDIFLDF
jgi:hypothetical protein